MEQYTDRLSQIAKHESYSRAAKKPQLAYRQPLEVIFDYEFTRLLKKLESMSGEYRKEEKGGKCRTRRKMMWRRRWNKR